MKKFERELLKKINPILNTPNMKEEFKRYTFVYNVLFDETSIAVCDGKFLAFFEDSSLGINQPININLIKFLYNLKKTDIYIEQNENSTVTIKYNDDSEQLIYTYNGRKINWKVLLDSDFNKDIQLDLDFEIPKTKKTSYCSFNESGKYISDDNPENNNIIFSIKNEDLEYIKQFDTHPIAKINSNIIYNIFINTNTIYKFFTINVTYKGR